MTKFTFDQIKKALEKLPYWQRSCYVDHAQYRMMPERWKEERRNEERRIFRGPGLVGTGECNVLFAIKGSTPVEVVDFLGSSQDYVRDLVKEVETLRAALKDTKDELDDFLLNENLQQDDVDMFLEGTLPKRCDTIRKVME